MLLHTIFWHFISFFNSTDSVINFFLAYFSTNFLGLITFVYTPTILMVFNYALLYYTHEKLKAETTIRSGVAYRSRFRS